VLNEVSLSHSWDSNWENDDDLLLATGLRLLGFLLFVLGRRLFFSNLHSIFSTAFLFFNNWRNALELFLLNNLLLFNFNLNFRVRLADDVFLSYSEVGVLESEHNEKLFVVLDENVGGVADLKQHVLGNEVHLLLDFVSYRCCRQPCSL